MKIAVIYHSQTDNTKKIAHLISQGAKISDIIEVKLMGIEEIDHNFVTKAVGKIVPF